MSSETYKVFTRKFAELRNDGLENHSNIDTWEYEWVGLEWPEGFRPQDDDFVPVNRLGKTLSKKDFPEYD